MGKGEHTRRAILEAAIARFGRDGYRATSVADIARDAGVGGTAAYAYFPGKEALFLAAIDEDAAGVIEEGLTSLRRAGPRGGWRAALIVSLIDAVDRHPLARRLLAGREPEFTDRVLEIPALSELRKTCHELIRADQAAGTIRTNLDPVALGNGVVAIMLSLLMSIVQLGRDTTLPYAADITAVFEAALGPPSERAR
jgi:AcrR family transcriptional regulator